MENEELLLRNTFLNARMGPLVEYNHSGYPNKSKLRGKLVWADEKRIPLTHEGAEEFDLINKINVESVVIHHHIESSQLKSALATSKRVPFGPKYTGEGKVDFYNQNDQRQTNEEMKETSSYESDMVAQPPQRAKFVPVSSTRCNDLNSYNRNQPPRNQTKTESNVQPSYQRQVLGQADMNSNSGPMMPRPYYHNDNHEMIDANPPQNTKANNGFEMHNEIDSRNEIFTKSSTDQTFKERKPLSSLQAQMPTGGPQTAMSSKSKNMHTKINRGISPNQPPQSKMNNEENKKSYQPTHNKNMSKDMDEPQRRSSSLKAKKEREKMAYNKPSPSSRTNNRG
jgi:hypothetical protein